MAIKVDFIQDSDFKDLMEMEIEVYGKEDMVDEKTVREWVSVNPYQTLIGRDEEGKMVGAVGLYHLKKESFGKIIRGEVTEQQLSKDDLLPFIENNKIDCYLTITVRNDNSYAAVSILSKVIRYFEFLKEHNIVVENVCAIGYTNKGVNLCQKLGFTKVLEYDPLESGRLTALYVKNLGENNASRFAKTVKGILLENNEAI